MIESMIYWNIISEYTSDGTTMSMQQLSIYGISVTLNIWNYNVDTN